MGEPMDKLSGFVRNLLTRVGKLETDVAVLVTGVSSVFGRTGAVLAATNDYTWAQINKATSSIADITTRSHTALTDIGTNTHAQIDTHIANTSDPHGSTLTQTTANITNLQIASVAVTSSAAELNKVDGYTGTAANLNTLTDDSMADALHRHSELSASDGIPNPALSVDIAGNVGIGTTSPGSLLHLNGTSGIILDGEQAHVAGKIQIRAISNKLKLVGGTSGIGVINNANTVETVTI